MLNKLSERMTLLLRGSSSKAVWREGIATFEVCLPESWPEGDEDIPWCQRDIKGKVEHSGVTTDISTLEKLATGRRIYVWSSPVHTLFLTTSIPTRNKKKLSRALPYALEDQLLGDPDAQQYISSPHDNGKLAVAITEKKRINSWHDSLKSAGLEPVNLAPANVALPYERDSWFLLFHNKHCWLRTSHLGGMVFPVNDTPPFALMSALKESRSNYSPPQSITLANYPEKLDVQEWANTLDISINPEQKDFWQCIHPVNCTVNLLQGEFTPEKRVSPGFNQFRPAFALFALWLLGTVAFGVWEWSSLNQQYKGVRQEMVELFRHSFPEARAIVDPGLQMQRKLSELQSGTKGFDNTDFMALLAKAAPAIQGIETVRIGTIAFDSNGLRLTLHLPDFQTLESLKNRLDASGLLVDVIQSNSRGTGVDGSLRVRSKVG